MPASTQKAHPNLDKRVYTASQSFMADGPHNSARDFTMHNQATSASGAPTGTYTSMSSSTRTLRADSPPESASGIRDALTHGEETLAAIHAALSHLESRLDTVITPIPPSPGEANAQRTTVPMIAMSHMRERLGAFNGSLSDALSRLNTLRDRVEV